MCSMRSWLGTRARCGTPSSTSSCRGSRWARSRWRSSLASRAAVLDVQNEDYVRTARAKGLAPLTVDRRHVLRNALLPVTTIVGLQTGLLLSGAVLTETVFAWPGVGFWLKEAIFNRDYPVLQGG